MNVDTLREKFEGTGELTSQEVSFLFMRLRTLQDIVDAVEGQRRCNIVTPKHLHSCDHVDCSTFINQARFYLDKRYPLNESVEQLINAVEILQRRLLPKLGE